MTQGAGNKPLEVLQEVRHTAEPPTLGAQILASADHAMRAIVSPSEPPQEASASLPKAQVITKGNRFEGWVFAPTAKA